MKEASRGGSRSGVSVAKRLNATTVLLVLGVFIVAGWILTGPFFQYSHAWRYSMSTLTTIATLLVLLLVYRERSRNVATLQEKLEELARATEADRDKFDRLHARRSRLGEKSAHLSVTDTDR